MTCVGCQNRIKKALYNTVGIVEANVSFAKATAEVTYDPKAISSRDVRNVIVNLDYQVVEKRNGSNGAADAENAKGPNTIGLLAIIVILYYIVSGLNLTGAIPLAETSMSFGMLFVIGLLTSVHCVAMCGGINLSQCLTATGRSPVKASALYNLGRVISYTVVGFLVGALGRVVTFDGAFKGVVQIIAGVFMVIMGLNILQIFPWLRRLMPRMPRFIADRIDRGKRKSKSNFVIGLLNGLMPCGPLQAMQIYALSTGSPVEGALSMMLFGLGTVPLMFGFGAFSSLLSRRFTKKMMTAGAILVTVLGMTMFRQGANLSGINLGGIIGNSSGTDKYQIEDGVLVVESTLSASGYPKITVQRGLPVRWKIDAPQGSINGCNRTFYISEYDVEHTFRVGENVVEFTPDRTGTFRYTCWMGMISGTIIVVDDLELSGDADPVDGSMLLAHAFIPMKITTANRLIGSVESIAARPKRQLS